MNRHTAAAAVLGCTFAATLAVAGNAVVQASPSTTHVHAHTLRFTTRELHTTALGKTEMAEADRLLAGGRTIGFGMTLCRFDFTTGVAHCNVTAAVKGGMLYGKIAVNGQQNTGTGSVTGGTGAYKDARGSIATHPARRKNETKVTITYHR